MRYDLEIKLNKNDFFDSSMNRVNYSYTKYFDIVFTILSFLYLFYTMYAGTFFGFAMIKKVAIFVCILLFPVIQPLIIYIKVCLTRIKNIPIKMTFSNDNIIISSESETISLEYINVYNFIKYKNMIVLMYDAVHGQIIPNRFLGENVNSFYDFVSSKIIEARKSHEPKNN